MEETDKAYIAGIIDGEGSITLSNYKGTLGTRYPVVAVDSTDRELIDHLIAMAGGTVVLKKKYVEHHQQAFTWRLTRRSAINLLREVRPYMRINRKTARVDALLSEYVSLTPRNGKYTPEMRAAKEDFGYRFHTIK